MQEALGQLGSMYHHVIDRIGLIVGIVIIEKLRVVRDFLVVVLENVLEQYAAKSEGTF